MRRILAHTLLIAALTLPPMPISADEGSGPPPEAEVTKSEEKPASQNEDTEEKSGGASEEQTNPNDTDTTTPTTKEPNTEVTATGTETAAGNATELSAEDALPDKQKSRTEEVSPSTSLSETELGALPASENMTDARATTETDDSNPENREKDDTSTKKTTSTDTKTSVATQSPKTDTTLDDQAENIRSDGQTSSKSYETEDIPDIIISEIQIAGDAANDEFIELYNPDSEDASLSGLRLCRRTSGTGISQIKSFSSGDTIPSEGYYLFAHTDGVFAGLADTTTKSSPLAANNAIALVRGSSCTDESATVLDSVAWGSGTIFSDDTPRTDNPSPDHSLVRDSETGDWSISEKPSPTNSDGEAYEEPEPEPEPEPTPDLPSLGTIIISELYPNPTDGEEEWIELRNMSAETVPLSNWTIGDLAKTYTFPDGTDIPGNGYFLLDATVSKLALNNTGTETVVLSFPDGSEADTVSYTDSERGTSYVRAEDDSLVLTHTPTPGADNIFDESENPEPTPDLPPPGTVILSEIFPNPIDEAEEWIELFNTSDEDIPLAGWMLADATKEYTLPRETYIDGNGFLVIPRSDSELALNNGSDTVTLIMPDGAVSDSYEYPKTVEESSWARNETGDFELTDIPTPGEANRFPVIEEPFRAPIPPKDSVRINEVFANPETKGEADEWIELANTSSVGISLAGFILRDASQYGKYVLGDVVAIGAGRFLVLPRSETGISLNNGVETLRLLWHDDETIITSLTYDRTVEGASYGYYRDDRYRFSEKDTPGKKNRFGKEPKIEDSDIPKKGYRDVPVTFSAKGSEDDMRYVWDFGDEHKSYKQETTHRYEETGTYHGSLTVRGDIEEVVKTFTIRIEKYPKHDLRITALLPNPDGRDTDFEWIRIENREKKTVDLSGWIIASGTTEEKLVNHKILTEDLPIGGGESLVLTRTDARFSLPNKHAVIELRRPDRSRADRITYDRPDGIDEEELLMIADDGSLVWVAPASSSESSTKTPAETAENAPEDPFLRGMTVHPSRFTFARFLALGTPFRLTLPDSAVRVLGLSDTRLDANPDNAKQDFSFLDSLFQSLNIAVKSVHR
jgi:hypothetical protein